METKLVSNLGNSAMFDTETLDKMLGTRFYSGAPKCEPLPYLKEGYKGKGPNGGRKCIMRQSAAYRKVGF